MRSFLGVGAPEAILVAVVALVVFGPKGLADVSILQQLHPANLYLSQWCKIPVLVSYAIQHSAWMMPCSRQPWQQYGLILALYQFLTAHQLCAHGSLLFV